MRIMVMGLPHTLTTSEFSTCAFTTKVLNLCRMMTERGHHVVHLGNEGSNPVCSENVAIMAHDEWSRLYRHPGSWHYDISTEGEEKKDFHGRWAASMRRAIEERLGSDGRDILCVTWGGAQREAVLPLAGRAFVVESGIGYRYSWADFRVFESYAWLHMTLAAEGLFTGEKWYWPVIPNGFDPDVFEYRENKGDYLLFLGRLNRDKGVALAVDLAQRAGLELVIAGQGDPRPYLAPHVRYVGAVNVDQRKELLAGARALICPTYYIEPLGFIAIEAQMSGTPVITTDFGAFSETVLHGVTGYRCRTMDQFEYAVGNLDRIAPRNCRTWAMNYSLERTAPKYEEYFNMLLDLREDGFYARHPERTQLDWLRMLHPSESNL